MASSITFYESFKSLGQYDLKDNTVKLMLVTSDYVPSISDTVIADVTGSPSPEVVPVASPDNGYTAGGEALASKTITVAEGGASESVFDAANLTWSALAATFRYGILYVDATIHSIVKPLIAYILFDTTPADVVVEGVDWTVQWNGGGIFKTS